MVGKWLAQGLLSEVAPEPPTPEWPGKRVPPGAGKARDAAPGPGPVSGEVTAGEPTGPGPGPRQRAPHRPEEGDLHLYRGRWRGGGGRGHLGRRVWSWGRRKHRLDAGQASVPGGTGQRKELNVP